VESLKVPVALNCLVVPTAMLEFAGVTAIESRVAPVTVNDAVPLTEPEVAVMVAVPVPVLVANPVVSTLATEVAEDDQFTDGSNCVLPSSKVPVALNCWLVPIAIDCTAGVTEIEIRWAATTVRSDVSVNEPTFAVIVVEPAATVVASPDPLMEAVAGVEDVQVTPLVKSKLEPSVYVAVAVYCWLMPMARVKPTGVTEMEAMLGAVTARLVDCETPAKLAEMLVVPAATAVTMPLEVMVAVAVADELHETTFVISALLPSL